jgi:hypothetical protein
MESPQLRGTTQDRIRSFARMGLRTQQKTKETLMVVRKQAFPLVPRLLRWAALICPKEPLPVDFKSSYGVSQKRLGSWRSWGTGN